MRHLIPLGHLRKAVLGLAACLVLTAAVYAGSRINIHVSFPVPLAGIDRFGCVNFGLLGPGHAKIAIHGKPGRINFAATAHGDVPNLSGRSQKFENQIVPTLAQLAGGLNIDAWDLKIKRDVYAVSKHGKAKAVLAGTFYGDLSDLL